MIVLDTDSLTLLMHGHERLHRRVSETDAVSITIVTRIEILQGRFDFLLKAADGAELQRAHAWLSDDERFIADLPILLIDSHSADVFDRLRAIRALRKIGRADLLIASITVANRARLVTRNRRHFGLVPGLTIEDWT